MSKTSSRTSQGFGTSKLQKTKKLRVFALEPILTPSGLVDTLDDAPDPSAVEIPDYVRNLSQPTEQQPLPAIDGQDIEELDTGNEAWTSVTPDSDTDLASVTPDLDFDWEEVPFVTSYEPLNSAFESGVFVVGDSGEVGVDFLFDGGGYRGELAFFSLEGMEAFEPGSEAFIQEAARRAMSSSELGHVVISDQSEGAQFSGILGNSDRHDFNSGDYQGVKTFTMSPGDEFGVMLVPDGKVAELLDNPALDGSNRPLFSMATANPDDAFQAGQIVDVTGDGNTFVFEDLRIDRQSDRDYNDVIFQIRGATGQAPVMDGLVDERQDWRTTDLGKDLVEYVKSQTLAQLPGDPEHPAITHPVIPVTDIDTGTNSVDNATVIQASKTVDIIDQISQIDPQDVFTVRGDALKDADFSVLDGEVSITYMNSSGDILDTQVLGRGNHKLQAPVDIPDNVTLKIEAGNSSSATYMLYGFESTAPEPFNIDLEFDNSLTASQKQILAAAAKNVASLIDQGLPTAIVDGKLIDDINIKISTTALDSLGGTQARTKIDVMRFGSLLPSQSLVQFDAADISELERSGKLFDVAQHEFLHALGFGNLWEAKGLVDYAGTSLAQYNGQQAVEAFQQLGGMTDAIALETQGEGSSSLHWHESLFGDEIMTADLNGNGLGQAAISTVTIAALADLGYSVNLSKATPTFNIFGGQRLDANSLTPEQIDAFRALAETSFTDPNVEYIAPIMESVDPDQVAPEIWAHAERFWRNGQYYDWVPYQIRRGDTLSAIALRTMGSAHPDYYWWIANQNGLPNPDWIVTGDWIRIPQHRPNYEWEMEQERLRREEELRRRQEEEARIRREQEEAFRREQERVRQEEERRRQEAEAQRRELEEQERRLREEMERRRQEEERRKEEERIRELERQAEIARQQGKGGLDWFLAKPLPEFGPADPFETHLNGETVGNLVPDDYYRFTLSRPGRIDARLMNLLADADLVLYDVRNRPISYSMREGITDEQILVDLIPGTYMLRVNSPKGVTTDYDLIVKFKHLLSRSEQGPPEGWQVGGGSGGSGGATGPLFSDPRIQRIYDTALANFAGPERAKANARITDLQGEKRIYEQQMQELLNQMNVEQRAKVHRALDDARHEANVWVDNIANPIIGTVDNLANGIINQANSYANRLEDLVNQVPEMGLGWVKDRKNDAKGMIRQGRDAITGAVNSAQSWLKGKLAEIQNGVKSAIWHFFETLKNAYRTGAEINGVIESVAQNLQSQISNAVRGANDLIGQFKGKVLSFAGWTKNLGINIGWPANINFNVYNNIVEPAVNAVADGFQGVISGIGTQLGRAVDWVKPRAQKAVAAVVDALFGDKTAHLWNKIHKVDEQIAATQTEVERKIVSKAKELQGQLNDFLNKLGTNGKKVFDTLMNFSNSPVAQIGIAVIEVILGLIPGVGQAIDVKDTGLSLYDILVGGKRGVADFVGLIGSLAGWVPGVGDAIKSVAKFALRGVDFLMPILKNLGPDITETVIKTAQELDWGKILKDVVNDITRNWNDIVRVFNNSADWILNGLGIKPVLATANGIVLGLGKSADEVGGQVNQAKKHLVEPLEDAANKNLRLPGPVKVRPGSIDDLLVGATKISDSKTTIYLKDRGLEAAWQDFRDFTEGFEVIGKEVPNPKQLFQADMGNGRTAIGRNFSSGGAPTIEIQENGKKIIEIRYSQYDQDLPRYEAEPPFEPIP